MKYSNTIQFKMAIAISISFLLSNCTVSKRTNEPLGLKESYKNSFLIGAALNGAQIDETDPIVAKTITHEFSAITPENVMKAEIIHPGWDIYNFNYADKLVALGKKYQIAVNGHTLIWHSQLPEFAKRINNSDSLRYYFENHIKTLASRYDGKIASWDVVNEALNEDGSLRNTIFLQKLGPNYIVEAFRLAQKAAPNTELYYNDFNIENPQKRAGAIDMIKKIQAAGVRIDGVGIQGHWQVNKVPFNNIEESIIAFSKLGLKVMFTELDITVLPNPWDSNTADVNMKAENNAYFNPYTSGIPDSIQQIFTKTYIDLFALFLKHKKEVTRVTFWGVNDHQSWLNDWPIKGRTNYPLLFDRNSKPKDTYYNILDLPKQIQ